ncbi:MAG: phage holin family protein [Haloechinothrix sp.]
MKLILGWLVLTITVAATVAIVPGLDVDWSPGIYWVIAAVLALVNVTLGVILRLLAFPLLVLTLGVFSLVLNAILLLVTDWLMDSLEVDGFPAALGGSIVITLVAMVIGGIIRSFDSELSQAN